MGLEQLEAVATEVVAANAAQVDRGGTFPSASIQALAEAGILGTLSAPEVGGLGLGFREASAVVERLAMECGSTAMVTTMHLCGVAVLELFASDEVRREAAAGRHLSTLAFSEAGSRSHFWAPVSTATRDDGEIRLDAQKSWVTSASHATAFVWSSRPVESEGASTVWLVPNGSPGLSIPSRYDGVGLRGNDSCPLTARGVRIPERNRLGDDGAGFSIMMQTVLPLFNVLISSGSMGLMRGALRGAIGHVSGARFEHLDSALRELPTIRGYVARAQIEADMAGCLLTDTITALEQGRSDAMLRVLQSKAATGEAALSVLAQAMRVCGGAAYRRDVAVDRYFRDGQAANVMAPTTDVLYDFVGKALTGMDLF